jgi:predicted PurR-regulated permease PerM
MNTPTNHPVDRPADTTISEHLPAPWNIVFSMLTRAFVWGLFFAALFVLRSFFLLLFLTFVFSYILANGAHRLEPYLNSRTLRVTLFSGLFLTILTTVILYLTPRVIDQGENFITQFGAYTQAIDREVLDLAQRYPVVDNLLLRLKDPNDPNPQLESPTNFILKQVVGLGGGHDGDPLLTMRKVLDSTRHIGTRIVSAMSAFLLALLFSFLIVLDLPSLETGVRDLRDTRLRFIYDEVFDSIRSFGQVLGQAFEAQFLIATANTALSGLGLYLLGLGPHAAFLCVIIFLFSFVPVAGVIISSIPLCLIALQVEGLHIMLAAIAMITVIHLIEGYLLNPLIYGSRMRINPVIVLIILTIGGTLFQFWGLILGVPICTYLFGHAIRLPEDEEQVRKG